jgi:hypothetical protein
MRTVHRTRDRRAWGTDIVIPGRMTPPLGPAGVIGGLGWVGVGLEDVVYACV